LLIFRLFDGVVLLQSRARLTVLPDVFLKFGNPGKPLINRLVALVAPTVITANLVVFFDEFLISSDSVLL
jgi:hypothetical protein